jgi:Transposase, Mutator family
MGQEHCSTVSQRVEWVSQLVAHSDTYGVVTHLSQTIGVSRQTLYSWKAKGEGALEQALRPVRTKAEDESKVQVERAILTLLVEGHASYRGIQRCLEMLLGLHVSVGKIAAVVQSAGQRAQQWISRQAPATARGLALDELYGPTHGEAYLNVVDVHSGMVWASTSLVGVDGESWTLLLWQLEEQGMHWQIAVSDGGRAIGEAVATVTPECPHQRDVWHILHACQQVQARLDRLVEGLRQRTPVVARQAARVAAGKRPRGKSPRSDVDAHAAELAQAQYVCEGLRYLSGELRQVLGVVVLTAQGLMPSAVRHAELEAWLSLLAELSHGAPDSMQQDLTRLVTLLRAALPHLVLFAPGLDELQEQACQALGPGAVHLLGWAWQRRAILGPARKALLEGLPADWQPVAAPLFAAWDAAVRASSVVENWHSVLRPYLAVHRTLSTGMLAVLTVWHNHRVAERGLHQGQSPLMRSGMGKQSHDWLMVLGYPPHGVAFSPELQADPQPTLALVA